MQAMYYAAGRKITLKDMYTDINVCYDAKYEIPVVQLGQDLYIGKYN